MEEGSLGIRQEDYDALGNLDVIKMEQRKSNSNE